MSKTKLFIEEQRNSERYLKKNDTNKNLLLLSFRYDKELRNIQQIEFRFFLVSISLF